MIKPDFWNDEKLGKESESVQLTFIATWNYSDDYGVVRANPVWLKNQIFPYKENLRLETFSKWLEALEKMDMLIKFTVRGEQYYYIRTFRLHQSVEKPSKTRNCSEEELTKALNSIGYQKQSDNSWLKVGKQSGNSSGVVGDEDKLSISVSKKNRAIALVGEEAPTIVSKGDYEKLLEELKDKELKTVVEAFKDFLAKKPAFLEPYTEYWNIAVKGCNVPQVKQLTDSRLKKLKARIKEPGFDFVKIIGEVHKSNKLKNESSWFSFDWIFENDKNYVKILEGNYAN